MHTVYARNVNSAYLQLFSLVDSFAIRNDPLPSRNGPVYRFPSPVSTVYERPWERVLFDAGRNANPFFHLMESLWMLLGRRDVASIKRYNSRFGQYSDNGEWFNAAYGHRWREYFGYDQMVTVVNILRKDPWSRRAVIGMWNPARDLIDQGSLDLPCNLAVKFFVRNVPALEAGYGPNAKKHILDMVVFNRSNDMIWGAYGANSVHMSFLHEYVAAGARMRMGRYTQVSADAHVYAETFDKLKDPRDKEDVEHYAQWGDFGDRERGPLPRVIDDVNTFDGELQTFWDHPSISTGGFTNRWLRNTAAPVRGAWGLYKADRLDDAIVCASTIDSPDWRLACVEWLKRIQDKRSAK